MSELTVEQLRDRTNTMYRDLNDLEFARKLRQHQSDIPTTPTDVATVIGWQVFLSCVERFGLVMITGDMEDYGREPGDIVWVTVGDWPGVLGPFPEAMVSAALRALEASR